MEAVLAETVTEVGMPAIVSVVAFFSIIALALVYISGAMEE